MIKTDIKPPRFTSGMRLFAFDDSSITFSYGYQNIRLTTERPLRDIKEGIWKFSIHFESVGAVFPAGSYRFTDHCEHDFVGNFGIIRSAIRLYRKSLLTQLFDSFSAQIRRMFNVNSVRLELERFEVENLQKPIHLGCQVIADDLIHDPNLRVVLGYDFAHNYFLSRVGSESYKWKGDTDIFSEAVLNPALEVNHIIYDHF